MEEKIFALDIGTRSVVGIILQKNGSAFQIVDMITVEHEERSMLDGQIHDVLSVSKVIEKVKTDLEKKHGTLTKVCVAAAGRALKTKRMKVSKEIKDQPLISQEDILHIELSAVQQAQYELAKEEASDHSTHYYCVGYSVLRYQLDEEEIGSLIDQQGEKVSVEIIATFLPKVVVESLLSALQRAGLEMEALTLEPIAAIHVLIPPSMRRLNVALVDIGAGTSDIALTQLGTVTAYGMVPTAGDEITEAISDQFLLDFPLAEQAKRNLSKEEPVTIQDILGFESEISYKDMVTSIGYAIENLAQAICDEILVLNNQSPKAVMLVGGGSQTPELANVIAKKLNLPENRVAIRGIDAIQNLEIPENIPQGPEFITPIGIAIAAKQSPVHYISVDVNDRTVRLFDMKTLTIGDCLLAAGIEMNKLYGRPGMAYIVNVNQKEVTLPGHYGEAPKIIKNGQPASLKDSIKNGDRIIVEKGTDGHPPEITLEELIGDMPAMEITWNDNVYKVAPQLMVNNHEQSKDYVVKDHDKITFKSIKTVDDFLNKISQKELMNKFQPLEIIINGKKTRLNKTLASLFKNGQKVEATTTLSHRDHFVVQEQAPIRLKELIEDLDFEYYSFVPVIFNDQQITLKKPQLTFLRHGEELTEEAIIHMGDHIKTQEREVEPFIFQDIFRYVDIDLTDIKGKSFQILKNGEKATFYEPLAPGDQLTMEWDDLIKK